MTHAGTYEIRLWRSRYDRLTPKLRGFTAQGLTQL